MTGTFTAKLDDLRWALTAVLPHSGTDATLPMLAGVAIAADGDTATLSATDRFTFARATIPVENVEGEISVFIQPGDVKLILTAHKAPKTGDRGVTVTVADNRVHILSVATNTNHADWSVTNPPANQAGTWDSLWGAKEGERGDVLLNAKYLARFEKAKRDRRDAHVLLSFVARESGPVRVTVGEDFRALIMPIRRPGA